ncbi:MAG: PilZ domain-containing protein [Candidatus Hydrogenedentes bacterium]|nr:PilZ domain-containing protein [Candidatus Hydrogenedentota bacterium]
MTHHVSPEERRKYPRSKRGLNLPIEVDGPGILNHVDNISANGLLCHTIQPVPIMTRLQIVIELPKPFKHRISAEGVVVRCDRDEMGDDKFKVGIVFTRIDEKDQEKIQEFVEYTLSEKI